MIESCLRAFTDSILDMNLDITPPTPQTTAPISRAIAIEIAIIVESIQTPATPIPVLADIKAVFVPSITFTPLYFL